MSERYFPDDREIDEWITARFLNETDTDASSPRLDQLKAATADTVNRFQNGSFGLVAEGKAEWVCAIPDEDLTKVRGAVPRLPEGVTGRFREKWSPLKRVAAAAGGDWPDRVDAMALHDKEEYAMDREDGLVKEKPAVILLSHIHEVWPDDTPFVPTSELIDLLVIGHPSVWGEEGPIGKRLTAHRLGRMLAQGYKIHSKQPVHGGPRGYFHAHFVRPWHQMRVTPPP
jgi:hypothetical protein